MSISKCVAVRYNVLQCVVVCCRVMWCVAVRYNVLQCVLISCSVLQRAVVCCSLHV